MTIEARAGRLTERLAIVDPSPRALSVSSLTSAGTTATATTLVNHGYLTGEWVNIAGATPSGYNGRVKITVTGAKTFTYTVANGLATPATGTITVIYIGDAQAGRRAILTDVDTIWAELMEKGAGEQLQAGGVVGVTQVRFRVRTRYDLNQKMLVTWTPSWPAGASARTLQIHGIQPQGDGRTWMFLDCGSTQP